MAWFDLLSSGVSAAGAYMASRQASRAMDDSNEVRRRELDLAERLQGWAEQGGTDLEDAFQAYYESIGDAGFFSPSNISSVAKRFAEAREDERGEIMGRIGDYVRGISGPGGATGGTIDSRARSLYLPTSAAKFGQYDDLAAGLAEQYRSILDLDSQSIVEGIMGQREVDAARRGLSDSSYDIATRRAAADKISELSNRNAMSAVTMALEQLSRTQGLDINATNAVNAIGDLEFGRRIRSMDAGTQLEANRRAIDSTSIREAIAAAGGIEALVGSTEAGRSYDLAYDDLNKLAAMRKGSLDELSYAVSTPYAMRLKAESAYRPLASAGSQAAYSEQYYGTQSANLFAAAGKSFSNWLANQK